MQLMSSLAAVQGWSWLPHPPYQFVPHAVCWRQDPTLIWTMAASNSITFLSYTAICVTLLFLARRTRRVIAREWAYFVVGFALFIVACGSTHLLETVTTWVPIFWVDAWTNIVTAVLSGYVAVQFFRRVQEISYGLNDYATRLESAEHENERLEDSLLAAQKLEEWSRMSAAMSHEIANPLESIQNLLYLIRHMPGVAPEARTYAQQASDEATRVLAMTRSTLGFFRQTDHPEPVSLEAVAESVKFVLDGLLRERGVEMEIATTGDLTVEAQPGESRQVLLNLVRNAVEASPVWSTVTVRLHGEPDGVVMEIEDRGHGISADLLPDLYSFGMTTKGTNGNGMGLWAVRRILERHGGAIGVDSEPGKGSRFTLWWPRKYPVEEIQAPAVPRAVKVEQPWSNSLAQLN